MLKDLMIGNGAAILVQQALRKRLEKFKKLLSEKEEIKEIPKVQRYISRPKIEELFIGEKTTDKQKRNKQIYKANIQYGYSQKEIADYLGVHYTTVSKALKEV